MYFIGVDPGEHGAWAVICPDKSLVTFEAHKDTESLQIVSGFLDSISHELVSVAIEDLRAMFGVSASATFALGWTTGHCHGICDAFGFQITMVPPKVWQAAVTNPVQKPLIPKGTSKNDRQKVNKAHKAAIKAESIRSANLLFPGNNIIHDGVADAVCMAYWLKDLHSKM